MQRKIIRSRFFLVCVVVFCLNNLVYGQTWKEIGVGVQVKKYNGKNIAICFSGWTVEQLWANHWADQLHIARLGEQGVGYLFAVKGPKDIAFESLEIETLSLVRKLANLMDSLLNIGIMPEVTVVAHSSGTYVAHNFFTHLFSNELGNRVLSGRIRYFCLDGGIGTTVFGTTITHKIAKRLKQIVAVYAFDPTLKMSSPNADAMLELAELFPRKTVLRAVSSNSSGCVGRWCLHETLIIKKPYNPHKYDLEQDYGKINSSRPVCWEYLR